MKTPIILIAFASTLMVAQEAQQKGRSLDDFSLTIPQAIGMRGEGVVLMKHATPYSIELKNSGGLRVDAILSVDGVEQGTYRLNPGQTWDVEHPVGDQGRFTFYAAGTPEAKAAALETVRRRDLGLISVRFVPERYIASKGNGGFGSKGSGAGGTGLSGESGDQYGRTTKIDRDEDAAVTITIRLAATTLSGPRPIPGRVAPKATSVPPPIQ